MFNIHVFWKQQNILVFNQMRVGSKGREVGRERISTKSAPPDKKY